jgi:hypothetical protein
MARVQYIGSKARIVEEILDIVGPPQDDDGFFVDAFSGTGVVGVRASELGWPIRTNDHLLSAVVVSSARLLGPEAVPFERLGGYDAAIGRLNAATPRSPSSAGTSPRTTPPSSMPPGRRSRNGRSRGSSTTTRGCC